MKVSWKSALGVTCLGAGLFLFVGGLRAAEPDKAEPAAPTRDPAPVAAAIDREIDQRLKQEKVPASPAADDAEFLRRAYVDITGKVPPADKAVAFLDSKDPDKRKKLIDELLASPDYGRHFGIIWSDLIVKRDLDNNRGLNTTAFKKWLADSFNENRGWDKTVTDLLTAEGSTADKPAALFFAANRDMTAVAPPKVVGTAGNLFMGVQIQCAECHNHAFIKEWKQTDFWGVAAFFSQTRASGGAQNMPGAAVTIGESATAPAGRRPGGAGGPRADIKGAAIEIPDATDPRRRTGKVVKAKFFLGEEPQLADKGPYRPTFATWLTSKDNKFFAKAAVNRLWAHFFARGFVSPLDDMHDDNEPSHPELLKFLADEFRASDFDLKHLIRSVCNSKAYQRTSRPVKENEDDARLFSHMAVKVMHPEVLYDSLCQALGTTELRTSAGGGRGGPGGGRGGGGGPREAFVNFFSTKEDSDDATEMSFGIPQYLRLMNSKPFNDGGAVIDKVMKDGARTDKVLEELFLTVLSRRPTETEVKKLSAYVAKKAEPKDGYLGVLWVLLNSAEFVCNR